MPYLVTVKHTGPGSVETRLHLASKIHCELVVDYCISFQYSVLVQHVEYATNPIQNRSKAEATRADLILMMAKQVFVDACVKEGHSSDEAREFLKKRVAIERSMRDEFGT